MRFWKVNVWSSLKSPAASNRLSCFRWLPPSSNWDRLHCPCWRQTSPQHDADTFFAFFSCVLYVACGKLLTGLLITTMAFLHATRSLKASRKDLWSERIAVSRQPLPSELRISAAPPELPWAPWLLLWSMLFLPADFWSLLVALDFIKGWCALLCMHMWGLGLLVNFSLGFSWVAGEAAEQNVGFINLIRSFYWSAWDWMLPPVFPIYYFPSNTVQNNSVWRGIHKEHGCTPVADFAKPCAFAKGYAKWRWCETPLPCVKG